jgi:hypothetical protein
MDKNPFSLYDFLGYVIPGSVALMLFTVFYKLNVISIDGILYLKENLISIFCINNLHLLIIISYLLGHLFAFVSSLTIEKYAIWQFKYPSVYLMGKEPAISNYFDLELKENSSRKLIERIIDYIKLLNEERKKTPVLVYWKLILIIVLFPISILSFFIGGLFRLDKYVVKNLDTTLRKYIEKKKDKLLKRLGIDESDGKGEKDNLRLIYHYQYERQTKQAKKMDNYVALYGFLRSITLIFVILFDYLLIKAIGTIGKSCFPDWQFICILIIVPFFAYVFYLAFLKFYRRYTLECFMALITDESLVDKDNQDI